MSVCWQERPGIFPRSPTFLLTQRLSHTGPLARIKLLQVGKRSVVSLSFQQAQIHTCQYCLLITKHNSWAVQVTVIVSVIRFCHARYTQALGFCGNRRGAWSIFRALGLFSREQVAKPSLFRSNEKAVVSLTPPSTPFWFSKEVSCRMKNKGESCKSRGRDGNCPGRNPISVLGFPFQNGNGYTAKVPIKQNNTGKWGFRGWRVRGRSGRGGYCFKSNCKMFNMGRNTCRYFTGE